MSKIRFILPLALILGATGVVYGLVALTRNKLPDKIAKPDLAVLVDVIPAQVESLYLSVVSQGTVLPRTQTTLVAEVPGKIVEVSQHFVAGGFFHKGEVLLQIDPSDFDVGRKRAHANLASRKAQYADQKARSEQALKDWKNLGRRGEPSDLTLRKPQLAEALAGVLAAEADLLKAERDLARTRISLPYDGLVRSIKVGIGQYVGPGAQLGVTFSIATAEVRLPLSSHDLAYLQLPSATDLGETIRPKVLLSAQGSGLKGEWEAEIIRTEGVVDEISRVTYAVAQVTDPYAVLGDGSQKELRIGTFVRAEIQGLHADNIIKLPRSVLRSDNTVLIANQQLRLEIRPVTVLRAEPRLVYLSSGITPGERVITTVISAPISGTLLSINSEPESQYPASSNLGEITGANQ